MEFRRPLRKQVGGNRHRERVLGSQKFSAKNGAGSSTEKEEGGDTETLQRQAGLRPLANGS